MLRKSKIRKGKFWLVNPFSYEYGGYTNENNIKIATYRGNFSERNYSFLVNFNAHSDGKVNAIVIDISNKKDASKPATFLDTIPACISSGYDAEIVFNNVKKEIKMIRRSIK